MKMVRGGPRGRGRGAHHHMKPRPPFIPHVPFDIVLAEPAFPPVKPPEEKDDKIFTDVSLKLQNIFSKFSFFTLRYSIKTQKLHLTKK